MDSEKAKLIKDLETAAKKSLRYPLGSPQRTKYDKSIDLMLIKLDQVKKPTKKRKTKTA